MRTEYNFSDNGSKLFRTGSGYCSGSCWKHMLGSMKPETALSIAKMVFLSDLKSPASGESPLCCDTVQEGSPCPGVSGILHEAES